MFKKKFISFFLAFSILFCSFSCPSYAATTVVTTNPSYETFRKIVMGIGFLIGIRDINENYFVDFDYFCDANYNRLGSGVKISSTSSSAVKCASVPAALVKSFYAFAVGSKYSDVKYYSSFQGVSNAEYVRPDSFSRNIYDRTGSSTYSRVRYVTKGTKIKFLSSDGVSVGSFNFDSDFHNVSYNGQNYSVPISNTLVCWYKENSWDSFVPRLYVTYNDRGDSRHVDGLPTITSFYGPVDELGYEGYAIATEPVSVLDTSKKGEYLKNLPLSNYNDSATYNYDYSGDLVIRVPDLNIDDDNLLVGSDSNTIPSVSDVIGTGSITSDGSFSGDVNTSTDASTDNVFDNVNSGDTSTDTSTSDDFFTSGFWGKLFDTIYNAIAKFFEFLSYLLSNIKDGIFAIPSLLSNIYDSILDFPSTIFDWTLPDAVALNFAPLYVDLSNKFPFCIPFDIVNSLKSLSVDSVAPKFEFTFDSGSWLISKDTKFVLDFSVFSKLAAIVRFFILFGFVWFLIIITRRVIGG